MIIIAVVIWAIIFIGLIGLLYKPVVIKDVEGSDIRRVPCDVDPTSRTKAKEIEHHGE